MVAIDHRTFVGGDDMHAVLKGVADVAEGWLPADGIDRRGFKHHICWAGLDKLQRVSGETEGVKLAERTPLGDQGQSLLQVYPCRVDARGMATSDDAGNYRRKVIFSFQFLLLFHYQAGKGLPNVAKTYQCQTDFSHSSPVIPLSFYYSQFQPGLVAAKQVRRAARG